MDNPNFYTGKLVSTSKPWGTPENQIITVYKIKCPNFETKYVAGISHYLRKTLATISII